MSDTNTRFMLSDHHIRGQIVRLEKSYQAILANADYTPVIANILGQALAAVSALGSTLKLDGSIILQVQGNGPVNTLVAQANSAGEIRGLAHHKHAISGDEGFTQLLGEGRIVITVDGKQGKRYQGIVQITGDDLSAALNTYFEQSEQLLTHIYLVADDKQASCFLLQQMPGATMELAAESWQHIKLLSDTLKNEELLNLDGQEILHRLFHEETVRLFEPTALSYRCRCSREKVIPAIEQMGYEEAMSLIEEQGEIRAECEFCNRSHRFDRVDVASLFKANLQPPSVEQ